MDEIDALVARVCADGPVPLPLDGWDRASIWGWDETTSSLYADLWRNSDDPAKPPPIRIRPGELTPAITCPVTLAQYIAMAVDRSPWKVFTALDEAGEQDDQDEDWDGNEEDNAEVGEGGTVVTMTEGYGIWWPPNFGSEQEKPA